MSNDEFSDFVRDHIGDLDRLSYRYAEYRLKVSQKYMNELAYKIASVVPKDYEPTRGTVKAETEERWGWKREVKLFGTQTTVNIAFGFYCDSSAFAREWPLANERSWTGIRVWIQPKFVRQFQDIAIKYGAKIKERGPDDRDWLCFWPCELFADVRADRLHAYLTRLERGFGQDEIIEELWKWKEIFEWVEAQVADS
jgi:hypothetical protein